MNVELFKVDTNNPEFQKALDLIENTNQSFFLTGKAGTGKSTFLRYIIDTVEKNFIVVAPTGIAAVNVNGMTIYSFFQFPLRPLLPQDDDIKVFSKDSEKRKIISKMDTLIIDEISMVRADIIDGIDYSLRKNGGNPDLPFGGKQVVFVGDMFQLEPVSIKSTGEYKIIKEFYKSLYFYGANIFNEVNLVSIELQKVYRQKNLEFIQLLDKVRTKEIKSEDIAKLNQRVVTDAQLKNKEFTITLTTTNGLALNVNKSKLSKLHSVLITYHANVSGEFQKGKYPTELELELKVGAQVIFIKNDAEKRWVNGTIGQVSELSEDEIKVTLENGDIYSVEKRSWENIKFQYNREKRKIEQEIVGTFEQYPLKLAWAITIHKSQGLTFESVVIDFGRGTFASGQAYVALSRATTLEGLFLKKKIFISDIRIDKEIIEFSKAYNSNSVDEILELAKPTFKYRKNNDFERLGNFYFEKAIALWIEGDFKLAAESLSEGFKQVTCDCVLGTLVKKEKDNIISSMKSNVMNCSSQDFDFLRTIFYYFSNQENRALPFINSFLEDNEASEVGNYMKGRILISLDNDEGLEWLDKALKINDNARLNYRIGRIKEQRFNAFGLDKIYKSITLNPSSTCSHRLLKNIATKRGVKLQTNTNKLLASLFNSQETETYVSVINKLLVGGSVQLSNDTVLSASNAFNSFSHTLRSDQDLFTSDRGIVEQETIDISELFGQDFDDATTLNEQSESSQKQIQLLQHTDANDNIQSTHDPEYWLKKVREALDKEAWTEAVSSGQKALFYDADFVKADIVLAYAFGRLQDRSNSLFHVERVDRFREVQGEVYRSLLSTLELYFLSVWFDIFDEALYGYFYRSVISNKLEKIAQPVKLSLSDVSYEELKAAISNNPDIHSLIMERDYQGESLPKEIGQLTNLTFLGLGDNNLTSLPKEIGQLSNLTDLYLSDNQLTSFPKEIGQLTKLTSLDLAGNQLTSLPKEIGQLTNLISLSLGYNNLTSFPKEIRQLTNLISLSLWENQLTSLSKEIGQLTNLTSLGLGDNRLTILPKEIGQLINLTGLYLQENELTSLPKEIGQLTKLTELHLDSNQLRSLPKEIEQLTNLTKLNLYSNQLRSLPKEIEQLTNLTKLYLHSNQLGSLPKEIGQLTNLTELHLHSNQLRSLPKEIGQLTNLTELHLHSNQLRSLPKEIGQLTNLTELNLSENKFTDSEIKKVQQLLPDCVIESESQDLKIYESDFLDDDTMPDEQSEPLQKKTQLVQHKDANDNIQNTHDPEYWLKKVREELDKEAWTEAVSYGQKALFYDADFVKADIVLAYAFGRLRDIDNSRFHIERIDRFEEIEGEVYRDLLSTLELYFLSVLYGIFEKDVISKKLENIAQPLKLELYGASYEESETVISNNADIHSLSLSGLDLSLQGIGQITNLIYLSVGSDELTSLPEEIGQLTNLIYLTVSSNDLTSLPKEIGQLTNLTSLKVYGNHCQLISLPKEIGQLMNLTYLDLNGNPNINSKDIFLILDTLTHLTYLGLGWNELISLPKEIGQLTNLTSLNLRSNKLTSLPKEIGQLTNLTSLGLWGNQLTILPKEIGQLTNLTSLSLEWNQLTNLPKEISNLANLTSLSLSGNQLTSLPKEIGQLTNLTSLNLGSNEFTSLSKEISNLANLTSLDLSGNSNLNWSNTFLILKDLSNLTSLNLGSNEFTSLPKEIFSFVNLISLNLGRNEFRNLPKEISNLANLTSLSLSFSSNLNWSNTFLILKDLPNLTSLDLQRSFYLGERGTLLPKEIGNLVNLTSLNLTHNSLGNNIPKEIYDLVNLTYLDLSYNDLRTLPKEIGNLVNLTSLDLSGNWLTSLPKEIGGLVNLTSLDLIQNSFGNMPKEISGLVNLTYLQLDDKSFSEIEIREIRNLLPNCEIIFSDFWRS